MTLDDAETTFGALVRRHRLAAGLTQEALAERAGLSVRGISDLERGLKQRPRMDTVTLLASALALGGADLSAFQRAARRLPAADGPPDSPRPLPAGGYLGALPLTTLVARDAEFARLRSALDGALAGQGRLLLLAGEPGVGKTRLAQEVLLAARDAGLLVLAGRCYDEQRAAPFFVFLDVLATAWEAASPALRAAAAQRHADLGFLLADRLPLPVTSTLSDSSPRIQRAVAGFLQDLAAERPLALLLDDLHWADTASIDLLRHLTGALHGRPAFLLGSYRDAEIAHPHPLEGTLATLLRERLVEVVSLRDMQLDGTAALVAAHFGQEEAPDGLPALVHARTEGNPFFVEEILKALVERGAVVHTAGGWVCAAAEPVAVPGSVRAVVRQRTNRLTAPTQELLQLASVLGQECAVEALAAAAGAEEEQLLRQVEAALAGGLLEERRQGRQDTYAFTHALIGQTLYEDLSGLRRRRLHLRAGEALELLYAGRPEHAQALARHFLAAGDPARGGRYAALAGDHAAERYALQEALDQYDAALAHLDPGDDEARLAAVHHMRARVLDLLGRFAEATAGFTAALRLYKRRGETTAQALIYRDMFWHRQDEDGAFYADRALALWPPDREDDDLAVVLVWGAWVRATHGDLAGAAPLQARAAALLARLGDSVLGAFAAQGLHRMAVIAGEMPYDDLRGMNAAVEALRHSGAYMELAYTLIDRAYFLHASGALSAAEHDHLWCLALCEEGQLVPTGRSERGRLAYLLCVAGRWEEGRRLGNTTINYGSPHWMAGEYAAALQHLDVESAHLLGVGDRAFAAPLLGVRASFLLQLGRLDAAHRAARDAYALLQDTGCRGLLFWVAGALAEAAAALDEPDASGLLADLEATIATCGAWIERPALLRARAVLLERQGRAAEALDLLEQSAASAREQGARVELCRSLQALSGVARAAGDRVRAALADAERRALVEAIGLAAAGPVWARF